MKRLILILVGITFFVSSQAIFASCYTDKVSYENYVTQYKENYNLWIGSSYNDPDRQYYYSEYQRFYKSYQTSYDSYQSCRKKISIIFDNGFKSFSNKNFEDSIKYFTQYLNENGDINDDNYELAIYNLKTAYGKIATIYFAKNDLNNAISYFKKALELDPNDSGITSLIGASYKIMGDYPNALIYYQKAYDNATMREDIVTAKESIEDIKNKIKTQETKKNSPTNDPLAYLQYYINDLNIPTAWKQVTNPKQVIVAIIDDGINVNHRDLANSIWINTTSEYGSSKVIDFVGDNLPSNLPSGQHGTMVAGIIGATINNNEGGVGIAKKVKLMPLRVFPLKGGAKEENIIKAINYAINNGANIINLSLGQSQFTYSKKYDDAIKKAYDLGIIVVIAAGNGDILANQETGINLDLNPISPVCNNGSNTSKYSLGVFATDQEGYRTLWTNYGKCTPFFAPGENIVSSSIPVYNSTYGTNYNIQDGTSFSAPIISGIIALGYNKFGKIAPSVVFDALSRATTVNSKNNPVLDTNKYLDILQSHINDLNIKNTEDLNKKATKQFENYKKAYSRFTNDQKKIRYNTLLSRLQKQIKALNGDRLIINNNIINLITIELNNL